MRPSLLTVVNTMWDEHSDYNYDANGEAAFLAGEFSRTHDKADSFDHLPNYLRESIEERLESLCHQFLSRLSPRRGDDDDIHF